MEAGNRGLASARRRNTSRGVRFSSVGHARALPAPSHGQTGPFMTGRKREATQRNTRCAAGGEPPAAPEQGEGGAAGGTCALRPAYERAVGRWHNCKRPAFFCVHASRSTRAAGPRHALATARQPWARAQLGRRASARSIATAHTFGAINPATVAKFRAQHNWMNRNENATIVCCVTAGDSAPGYA